MKQIREKGITLLSLIVTIIILLMLVGVTIGQITGNKGLFNRVRKTVAQYENTQEQEDAGMVELETMLAEEREDSTELEEPTANPGDVLLGRSYYDKNKEPQEGTMPNQGSLNKTIGAEGSLTLDAGYYSGGTIKAEGKEVVLFEKGLFKNCIFEENKITSDLIGDVTINLYGISLNGYNLIGSASAAGFYLNGTAEGYICFTLDSKATLQVGAGTGVLPDMISRGAGRAFYQSLQFSKGDFIFLGFHPELTKYIGLRETTTALSVSKISFIPYHIQMDTNYLEKTLHYFVI